MHQKIKRRTKGRRNKERILDLYGKWTLHSALHTHLRTLEITDHVLSRSHRASGILVLGRDPDSDPAGKARGHVRLPTARAGFSTANGGLLGKFPASRHSDDLQGQNYWADSQLGYSAVGVDWVIPGFPSLSDV